MNKDQYIQALRAAESDLQKERIEREQTAVRLHAIEKRIAQLNETIDALRSLVGVQNKGEIQHLGLTDACRDLLRTTGAWMTTVVLKDRLDALGFDFSNYTKPLSAINTVMVRLVEAGVVESGDTNDRRKIFRWKSVHRELPPPPGYLEPVSGLRSSVRDTIPQPPSELNEKGKLK